MEPGHLAGIIIVGSMATGAIAIVGFCLHVMFTRRMDCSDVDIEAPTTTLSKSSSNIFNISGRLPPPPPLSPPPPPTVCGILEMSGFSNSTSITQVSESDYESMQELTSSSDDTTLPRVIFTSDFPTSSSLGQGQSSKDHHRAGDMKISGHVSPSVSVIREEDEDRVSWLSISDAASRISTTPTLPNVNQTSLFPYPTNVPSTQNQLTDMRRNNTSATGTTALVNQTVTSPQNPVGLNVPQPSTPRRTTRLSIDSSNTTYYGNSSMDEIIQHNRNNSTGT